VKSIVHAVAEAPVQDIVELLDPSVIDRQRQTLRDRDRARFSDLSEEALAELTFLGLHPAKLRAATLALVSRTSREELHAYRLAECHDTDRFDWTLTPEGDEIADLLASTAPEPSKADLEGARQRLGRLLKQAKQDIDC
jgi:hypothetical protein